MKFSRAALILIYVCLLLGAIAAVTPLFWLVSCSFKPSGEIFSAPPTIIPKVFTLVNFRGLFRELPYERYFFNSLFVSSATTLLTLFFCSLCGFGFAKYDFRCRKFLFLLMLGSVMVPFQVLLVPLFELMYRIGWMDSYLALIVPFSAGGFGVFLMRQYIRGVPSELLDAARVDGCSEFGLYSRIVLPVIKPALGALTVYVFLGTWNDFLWPLVILRSDEKYTLPIGLSSLIDIYNQQYGILMAGTFLSALPVIVLFLLLQREFVSGITLGAVKE